MGRLRACISLVPLLFALMPDSVQADVILQTDAPMASAFSNSRFISDAAAAGLGGADSEQGLLNYLPNNDAQSDLDRMLSALRNSLDARGADREDPRPVTIRYQPWPSLLLMAIALVMIGFACRHTEPPVQAGQRAVRYVPR